MSLRTVCPAIIVPGEPARELKRLPRVHTEFDEDYLQELLAKHPEILPVHAIRADIGSLLCIGREIAVSSGSIDILYLSTAGYPVIVETKLWRNPQARREVLSQTLDYVKDVVQKDYEWFEEQWAQSPLPQDQEPSGLISELNRLSADELDETFIVDRVNRALANGDVIALIVGDGIETRLQELVAHLCKDSSHLRYSLALIELGCFKIGEEHSNTVLVIPRIVQDVEPVQRAYVRVEVAQSLRDQIAVTPVIDSGIDTTKYSRVTLNEDDFSLAVQQTAGRECADSMRQFYNDLVQEFSLKPDFKTAAVMLKVPSPDGEGPDVSIIALEKQGRLYNTQHMFHQLKSWNLNQETVENIVYDYWSALHTIDSRFREDGINHLADNQFVPFLEIADKLPEIKHLIGQTVSAIKSAYEESL